MDKQIKSSNWLTEGYSQEELEKMKAEAIKEAEIEEMALTDVDILANDINQHCPDLAENYCGGTHCVACLSNALTAKGYRKASDVAAEIFAEIEEMLKGNEAVCENKRIADIGNWIFHEYLPKQFAELKKKYTKEIMEEE